MWSSCYEDMIAEGVHHGKVFPVEFFEERLHNKFGSVRFGFDIARIRRELETNGYYLSGRGMGGKGFVIVPPESNTAVCRHHRKIGFTRMKRGVILGNTTRTELMTEEQRRRHESQLERLAIQVALIDRSGAVARLVKKHNPRLLENKKNGANPPDNSENTTANEKETT